MDLFSESDKIKYLIFKKISNNTEFEVMFSNYNDISLKLNDFINVLKYLKLK